jgi:hypothetical protein
MGDCDVPESCDGYSSDCPMDMFKPPETLCRDSMGDCDVSESCTGYSAVCPPDNNQPKGTLCRLSNGICDSSEYCTGTTKECPPDEKQPSSYMCRAAVTGSDGTTCDSAEYCTGYSDDCPDDQFLSSGVLCRGTGMDQCDVAEYCDGICPQCPPDLHNDYAYTYKCGETIYLCAVGVDQLTKVEDGYSYGSEYSVCDIGSARDIIQLPWPLCVGKCIDEICPNGLGLINLSEGHCLPSNGKWACDLKIDVDYSTALPHCMETA